MQSIFTSVHFDLNAAADALLGDFDDDGNFVQPDALDMPTVSFDEVEETIALELFDAEEAEERAFTADYQDCCECGRSHVWTDDDEDFMPSRMNVKSGNAWCCSDCYARAQRKIEAYNRHRDHRRKREALELRHLTGPTLDAMNSWSRFQIECRRELLVSIR